MAVILLSVLFVIKRCRKKRKERLFTRNSLSSRKASLQSSFTNPSISSEELPQTALVGSNIATNAVIKICFFVQLQELQMEGLVYPFSLLSLSDELGTGAFGIVRRAHLLDPTTLTTTTVAVKMLKGVYPHEYY